MPEQEHHVPGQWVVLSAVANAMDEQNLSTTEAMTMLEEFLSEQPAGPAMRECVQRLKSEADDFQFRLKLGEECLRLMDLDEQLNPVKRGRSQRRL